MNGVTPETEETPVTVVTMDASAGPVDGLDEQLVQQLAERSRRVQRPHHSKPSRVDPAQAELTTRLEQVLRPTCFGRHDDT